MNDLLAAFGIDEEDLKTEKKLQKKSQEGKKDKTKKSYASKNKVYQLPIYFYAGHMKHIFLSENDEGRSQWDEKILKENIAKRFPELKGVFYELSPFDGKIEESRDSCTYITAKVSYTSVEEVKNIEFPVTIVAGDIEVPVDHADAIEDIQNIWIKEYPEYTGCKFHYVATEHILIPFMESNISEGKCYNLPITVGYLDEKEVYEKDDFSESSVTIEKIRERYVEAHPEFVDCEFAYQEHLNLLFPLISKRKNVKEQEKKISLPVEVRAGGFSILMQEDDFNNKTSATLEEIRKVLESHYPEYSKERTEMIYDKRHFIVPVLKSSKKGVVIQPLQVGWNHEVFVDENGDKWRRETTPLGVFETNMTKKTLVQFSFKLPKIPYYIVKEVIKIFERIPTVESAVQIFFNTEKNIYEIYEPKQCTTSSSVIFQRSLQEESKKILVMDIHSHGAFSAFFSSTDDKDEKGIRLYMVIGNLNQKEHTYALRAGMVGYFETLSLQDVFE